MNKPGVLKVASPLLVAGQVDAQCAEQLADAQARVVREDFGP